MSGYDQIGHSLMLKIEKVLCVEYLFYVSVITKKRRKKL